MMTISNPRTMVQNANELFKVLDRNFGSPLGADQVQYQVPVNVFETPNGFRIELITAGYRKEDLNLSVKNNLLTVSASLQQVEKATENKAEEAAETDKATEAAPKNEDKVIRREFHLNGFERSFKIPKTIDLESITATFNNGILTLEMTKIEEVDLVKRIEIQ
ncbi:Hsp20/alpha crystallin family protein [Persicobacter psychrovividus]|uniref:SHSP domain-containing protein n=1 Tax=Persicobacter psychrovividus TaxID=387638 RepID=A0ABM7VCL0_9BACT|nr:hypothetical protein PEPS_06990 [Persicobacter psychrovividus]